MMPIVDVHAHKTTFFVGGHSDRVITKADLAADSTETRAVVGTKPGTLGDRCAASTHGAACDFDGAALPYGVGSHVRPAENTLAAC